MNTEPIGSAGLARLRQAFAEAGPAAEPCPPPETIFDGAHGHLAEAELGALLDHLAACPACSREWLLARELAPAPPADGKPGPVVVTQGRFGRPTPGWVGLLAALLLAAVALPLLWPAKEPPPVVRGDQPVVIVDASGPLGRQHCVLRWRLVPPREGASFAVKATTGNLEPVADRAALTRPELEIPADRLATIGPGGELLWQVEASFADGSRSLSPTFRSFVP